jgi:hypothetical protein
VADIDLDAIRDLVQPGVMRTYPGTYKQLQVERATSLKVVVAALDAVTEERDRGRRLAVALEAELAEARETTS